MTRFRQAARSDVLDGPVRLKRGPEDTIELEVEHAGERQCLVMSEHNAALVFGMLSLMLEIQLPKVIGQAITVSTTRRFKIKFE